MKTRSYSCFSIWRVGNYIIWLATGVNLVSGKLGNKCINLREYMKAVVDAVRFCHELKIVHRDIKVYIN